MKAARFYAARDVRVEDVDLPPISCSEVKIEVEWCGLCGSDKHMYLKPFDIPCPVTLGHEFSGTVTDVGNDVTKIKPGDRVVVNPLFVCGKCPSCKQGCPNLCDHLNLFGYHQTFGAFADVAIVQEDMVIKIPDSLPFDIAAITEPAAIALHALRMSQFKAGDSAAVFGAGPIGLLLISLLKASGASKIFAVGHTESKRQHALRLGATLAIDPDKENPTEVICNLTDGGVNVTFDLAGVQESFSLGLSVLRTRGEMVIVSLSDGELLFDAMSALRKEIKIITSQCSSDEFPIVVDLLASGILNTEGIITKVIHLDDIVTEGFEALINDKSQLKILVTPKKENIKR